VCSSNENGYISIKYFKEIKNIQTGEQIEIKSTNVIVKSDKNKHLSPIAQYYIPNQPTGMTLITIPSEKVQETKITPATQQCGEPYDPKRAWKDVQAEQAEYIDVLTRQNENIHTTKNIPQDIPHVPCHTMQRNNCQDNISNTSNTSTQAERIRDQTKYEPKIPT